MSLDGWVASLLQVSPSTLVIILTAAHLRSELEEMTRFFSSLQRRELSSQTFGK